MALAAVLGASLLLATAMEARAKTFKLECTMVAAGGCFWVTLTNTTGSEISLADDIRFTFCSPKECQTIGLAKELKAYYRVAETKLKPGESARFCFTRTTGSPHWSYWSVPYTVDYCSIAINLPDFFEPRAKRNISNFTRVKPPGPPQPGLLEDSPGFSRQTPSSVGTQKLASVHRSQPHRRRAGAEPRHCVERS